MLAWVNPSLRDGALAALALLDEAVSIDVSGVAPMLFALVAAEVAT